MHNSIEFCGISENFEKILRISIFLQLVTNGGKFSWIENRNFQMEFIDWVYGRRRSKSISHIECIQSHRQVQDRITDSNWISRAAKFRNEQPIFGSVLKSFESNPSVLDFATESEPKNQRFIWSFLEASVCACVRVTSERGENPCVCICELMLMCACVCAIDRVRCWCFCREVDSLASNWTAPHTNT